MNLNSTPSPNDGPPKKAVPSTVADAVLKVSAPIPGGVRKVQGIEFDDFKEQSITVEELVNGMAGMGFQASAVSDAVRIINEMVWMSGVYFSVVKGLIC